jgi:hypothetical protein
VTSTSAIKRLTRKLAEMASELTLAVETVGAELQFAPLLDSIEQLNRQTAVRSPLPTRVERCDAPSSIPRIQAHFSRAPAF